MAARAYWRGQIRLTLVSMPVEIYSATKSGATIAFNRIHEPSGKRIRYEKVVPGIGPIDVEDIVKGFEYAKGEHILLAEKGASSRARIRAGSAITARRSPCWDSLLRAFWANGSLPGMSPTKLRFGMANR